MIMCTSYTILFIVPNKPRLLEIVSINSSSVTLQWMPPDTPNGIITHYSLKNGTILIANLSSNVLMFTVGGLSPLTMYELQLRAHTRVGEGPPSSVIVITSELIIEYCYMLNIV